MLRLQMADRTGNEHAAGPAARIRIAGRTLRLEPGVGSAEHVGEGWRVGEQYLTRLEIPGPVTVFFESEAGGPAVSRGPFDYLRIVNGYLFAGGLLLAFFSEDDQRWCALDSDRSWPALLLHHSRPAAADRQARHEMIARAAYFRAERRGFAPELQWEDWLAAEQEIDALLASPLQQ